jgi:hypothetical protein
MIHYRGDELFMIARGDEGEVAEEVSAGEFMMATF